MSVLWTSSPRRLLVVGYMINNTRTLGEFAERAKKMVKLFNVISVLNRLRK
jgi:hypothetical protein